MSKKKWTAVDKYFDSLFAPSDPALDAAVESIAAAGMPEISVSPGQGKLLYLLARMQGAKKILEIGTLGGYSTIWMARALPKNGLLVTLEADAKHARVAASNIARAGLAEKIDLRRGKALSTLPKLVEEGAGPFDLIFIDADKRNNPRYFEWALKLSRRGSLIVIDNVVREGDVADAKSEDPNIQGTREALEMMAREPRVISTAMQTVGSKGYDGFSMAFVVG